MISPKSRPLWVGTSSKMNKTLTEAESFGDELLELGIPSGVQPTRDQIIEILKLCAPLAGAGAGQSTNYSRNLPWRVTAALL